MTSTRPRLPSGQALRGAGLVGRILGRVRRDDEDVDQPDPAALLVLVLRGLPHGHLERVARLPRELRAQPPLERAAQGGQDRGVERRRQQPDELLGHALLVFLLDGPEQLEPLDALPDGVHAFQRPQQPFGVELTRRPEDLVRLFDERHHVGHGACLPPRPPAVAGTFHDSLPHGAPLPQPSPVEYAPTHDGFVAHRHCGTGPPHVVLVSDWFSHQGDLWRADSPFRPVLDRLSSFSHLVTFDKRGIGLSDPVQLSTLPTLEEWVDDLRCVLDTLGIDRAVIIGKGSGGPMAALFAATHPKRVSGLVFVNAWARMGRADDFDLGVPEEIQEVMLDTPYMPASSVELLAGEPVTDALEAWWQAYVRSAASPGTSSTMRRWLFSVDVRAALPSIRCPSLVICRKHAWIGAAHARFLQEHIGTSKLVILPGSADFL